MTEYFKITEKNNEDYQCQRISWKETKRIAKWNERRPTGQSSGQPPRRPAWWNANDPLTELGLELTRL